MKIVTIKGLWLLHWHTKFHIDISSRLWVIGISDVENRTHTYTRTLAHTHTSGRQLKITFLDVSDYSEYSDTKISKKKFFSKTKLPQWGSKNQYTFFSCKNIIKYRKVYLRRWGSTSNQVGMTDPIYFYHIYWWYKAIYFNYNH